MHSKNLLFTIILFIAGLIVSGQGRHKESAAPLTVLGSEDIFRQGAWNFNLNQILQYQPGTSRQDGEKTGTFSNYDGRIEANHFIIDHIGLGAGIRFTGDKTTNTTLDPDNVEKINTIGGYGNILYGTSVGGVVNIIAKASIGGGKQKETQDYGYGEYEEVIKYINFLMSVGSPIEIDRNIYFTPSVGWEIRRNKGDGFKELRNGVNIGLNMDFFMGCGDDQCDLSSNPLKFSDRFRQGEFHLGSRMYGMFQAGSQKTTYGGEGNGEVKDGFGNTRLSGYGLYYPINNFGVGIGLDYYCDRTSNKDDDFKQRQSEFLVNPIVRYHIPVENMLKNFYGEGSFGYGWNSEKTTDGGEDQKNNATAIDWKLGVGYNYFVSEHFSLSPMVGYGSKTLNYKDSDVKTRDSGIYAGIGWNYHLR